MIALTDAESATVRAILQRILPPGVAVHVFGSRASGRCKPWSDLDLVLEGAQALPLSLIAELNEAFAESDLPWKVDVIDRSTISSQFGALVDRTKVPFI